MATKQKRKPSRKAALEDRPPRADGTPEGVNLSQLMEWARCRYRWDLKNRRHIDRRSIARPLDLGSAVHAGIAGGVRRFASNATPQLTPKRLQAIRGAAVASINTWADEFLKERGGALTTVEETQSLDEVTSVGFDLAWKALQDLQLDRFETVRLRGEPLIEQKITCDYLPGLPFYGTPDWVVKDRQTNQVFPIDYKVRQYLQPYEHEEVDLQLPVYQYLLLKNGIHTVGAIKWQVRNEPPRKPELNKNGTMSRQRIATTWEVYKAALVEHGLDPDDYLEMQQKLDVEFFRVDRIYRNQYVIGSIWEQIIVPMGQLFVKSKTQFRNMHYLNCNGCWAREFCIAELRGEDTEFLLETSYVNLDDPKAKVGLRPEDFVFVED